MDEKSKIILFISCVILVIIIVVVVIALVIYFNKKSASDPTTPSSTASTNPSTSKSTTPTSSGAASSTPTSSTPTSSTPASTNSSSTTPILSCQSISDVFNVYPSNTSPIEKTPDVYNYWQKNLCKTLPSSMLSCQNISNIYGAYPSNLANAKDLPNVADFWNAKNCLTISGFSSCQEVSDKYGTTWNRTYGTATDAGAPIGLKQYWDLNYCNTIPTNQQNNCQLMSDLWGAYPGSGTKLIKEPNQLNWFVNNGCKTASGISSCQQLSDNYGFHNVNGVPYDDTSALQGEGPAQNYWKANSCDTQRQIRGRYINFIKLSNQQAIAVREIQIYSSLAQGAVNIAANKTVKMSSTYLDNIGSNATDSVWSNVAWTTDKDDPTFIQVDLGSDQPIVAIEVFNRIDFSRRNNGCVIQIRNSQNVKVYESSPVQDFQDSTVWNAQDDANAIVVGSWQCLPPSTTPISIVLGNSQNFDVLQFSRQNTIELPIIGVVDLQNPSGTGYQQSNVKNLFDNMFSTKSDWSTEYNFSLPALRTKLQLSLTLRRPSEIWYVVYFFHIDSLHVPTTIEIYNGQLSSADLVANTNYVQKTSLDPNSKMTRRSNTVGWYVVPLTTPIKNCSTLTVQVTATPYENWPVEVQVFGYEQS